MIRSFLCALSYFTRVPVRLGQWPNASEMRTSLAWLPLIGTLTGIVAAGVWVASQYWWDRPVATLLAMGVYLLFAGAMHEDGFADACDGLGVSGPRERVLSVLKDPQMGTFGSIGLFGILALRWMFWSALEPSQWVWIPFTEALSRVWVPVWSWCVPYARKEGPSKVDFLRLGQSTWRAWGLWLGINAGILGFMVFRVGVPTIAWGTLASLLGGAIPVLVYWRKVGGVTGDVLGASQQCALWGVWFVWTAV